MIQISKLNLQIPYSLLREISELSNTLISHLKESLEFLDEQNLQICTQWISYFEFVANQFKSFYEFYSEVYILQYLDYFKETISNLKTFSNSADILKRGKITFEFGELSNQIAEYINELQNFLSYVSAVPYDFFEALELCSKHLESQIMIISKEKVSSNPFESEFECIKFINDLEFISNLLNSLIQSKSNIFISMHDYDPFLSKLLKIRNEIIQIYEENSDKISGIIDLVTPFYYVSISCFQFLQLEKPKTFISENLFNITFILDILAISVRNQSTDMSKELKEKALEWYNFFSLNFSTFIQLIQKYNSYPDPSINPKDDFVIIEEFYKKYNEFLEMKKLFNNEELVVRSKHIIKNLLLMLNQNYDSKKKCVNRNNEKKKSLKVQLSLFSINTRGIEGLQEDSKRKLCASQSMEHLSLNSSTPLFTFNSLNMVSQRKPILIDPNSPIKIKPSGRHISFNFKRTDNHNSKSTISSRDSSSISELFISFIPKTPFSCWSIKSFREKVSPQNNPIISYKPITEISQENSFQITDLHLPSIKDLAMDKNDKSTPRNLKSSNHFINSTKSKKFNSFLFESTQVPVNREMSSNMLNMIKKCNKTLRKYSSELNQTKKSQNIYKLLLVSIKIFPEVYDCIPCLSKFYKSHPNDEFFVDANREYENIRMGFDQLINDYGYSEEDTFLEMIEKSRKQLSLILFSLNKYSTKKRVANNIPILKASSKAKIYLIESMNKLQKVSNCSDPLTPFCCVEFLKQLRNSITTFLPIFQDLEALANKHILMLAANSLLNNLKFTDFIQNYSDYCNINNTIIAKQFFEVKELLNDMNFMNSNKQSTCISTIDDLIKNFIENADYNNPLIILDINELANVIESELISLKAQKAHIHINNNKSNTAQDDQFFLKILLSLRKFQLMLITNLDNDTTNNKRNNSQLEEQFIKHIQENESDFNELANHIHIQVSELSSAALNTVSNQWIDVIHQTILNFADLIHIIPIIFQIPILFIFASEYYNNLIQLVSFFEKREKSGIDIDNTLPKIISGLKRTQNCFKIKAFEINCQIDTKKYSLFQSSFDFSKYNNGFPARRNKFSDYFSPDKIKLFAEDVIDRLSQPFEPMYSYKFLNSLLDGICKTILEIGNAYKNSSLQKQIDQSIDLAIENYFSKMKKITLKKKSSSSCIYDIKKQKKLISLLLFGDFLSNFFEFALILFYYDEHHEKEKTSYYLQMANKYFLFYTRSRKNARKKSILKSSEISTNEDNNSKNSLLQLPSIDPSDIPSDLDQPYNPEIGPRYYEYYKYYESCYKLSVSKLTSSSHADFDEIGENRRIICNWEDLNNTFKLFMKHIKSVSKSSKKSINEVFKIFIDNPASSVCELFLHSYDLFNEIAKCKKKIFSPKSHNKIKNDASLNIDEIFEPPLTILKLENKLHKKDLKKFSEEPPTIELILIEARKIPEILSKSPSVAASFFTKYAYYLKIFEQNHKKMFKNKENQPSKLLYFITQMSKSRYFEQQKPSSTKSSKSKHKNNNNIIMNQPLKEKIDLLEKSIIEIYRYDLISNTHDPNCLLGIISQILTEIASIESISDDHILVMKIIQVMGIAILHSNINNIRIHTETLKFFANRINDLLAVYKKEYNEDAISDKMIDILNEIVSNPIQLPGLYGPFFCLQLLLSETDET